MVIVGVHTVWYWRRRPRRVRESTSGICRAYLSSTDFDREQIATSQRQSVQHAEKNKPVRNLVLPSNGATSISRRL